MRLSLPMLIKLMLRAAGVGCVTVICMTRDSARDRRGAGEGAPGAGPGTVTNFCALLIMTPVVVVPLVNHVPQSASRAHFFSNLLQVAFL